MRKTTDEHFWPLFRGIALSFIDVIVKEYDLYNKAIKEGCDQSKEENFSPSFNFQNQQNPICGVAPLVNEAGIDRKTHILAIYDNHRNFIYSHQTYPCLLEMKKIIEEFIRISNFSDLTLFDNKIITFDAIKAEINALPVLFNDEAKIVFEQFNFVFGEIDFTKIRTDLLAAISEHKSMD